MSIQFCVFSIPVSNSTEALKEMNSFLRGHRILEVTKGFIENAGNSFWTFCIEYLYGDESSVKSATAKTDYREILSESDFSVFAQLRGLRKEIAEKEGLPSYVLFTNEQLARMVQNRATTEEAIAKIPGVGQARTKKYGEAFLRILRDDMVIWGSEKNFLKSVLKAIKVFLDEKIVLQFKPFPFINRCEHGLDFLGFRLFPQKALLNRRSCKRLKRRWKGYSTLFEKGLMSQRQFQDRITALTAFTLHADTSGLRGTIFWGDGQRQEPG